MLSTPGEGNTKLLPVLLDEIVTCVVDPAGAAESCCPQIRVSKQSTQTGASELEKSKMWKIADSIAFVHENIPFSDQLIFLIAAYSKVRMVQCVYWRGGDKVYKFQIILYFIV